MPDMPPLVPHILMISLPHDALTGLPHCADALVVVSRAIAINSFFKAFSSRRFFMLDLAALQQ
jgi:hypothetical protein